MDLSSQLNFLFAMSKGKDFYKWLKNFKIF